VTAKAEQSRTAACSDGAPSPPQDLGRVAVPSATTPANFGVPVPCAMPANLDAVNPPVAAPCPIRAGVQTHPWVQPQAQQLAPGVSMAPPVVSINGGAWHMHGERQAAQSQENFQAIPRVEQQMQPEPTMMQPQSVSSVGGGACYLHREAAGAVLNQGGGHCVPGGLAQPCCVSPRVPGQCDPPQYACCVSPRVPGQCDLPQYGGGISTPPYAPLTSVNTQALVIPDAFEQSKDMHGMTPVKVKELIQEMLRQRQESDMYVENLRKEMNLYCARSELKHALTEMREVSSQNDRLLNDTAAAVYGCAQDGPLHASESLLGSSEQGLRRANGVHHTWPQAGVRTQSYADHHGVPLEVLASPRFEPVAASSPHPSCKIDAAGPRQPNVLMPPPRLCGLYH